MFRDLLSSRLLQVGLVFCVVVVGGSMLYSWQTRRTTVAEFPQRDVALHETRSEQNTVDTSTVDFEKTETPLKVDDLQTADDTDASPIDEPSEFVDVADAFLPEDIDEIETPEVRVSPHGFGPYPEVPEDLVAAKGLMPWQAAEMLGHPPPPPEIELGARVLVKLWKEGDTQWTGARMNKEGIMFIHYPNRVYVRYRERKNPDGTTSLTIARVSSGGTPIPGESDIPPDRNIPPGIEIIDLDNAKVGIDPYTFLGIDK